jgi:uncharacterized protein (TIGR00369 family)
MDAQHLTWTHSPFHELLGIEVLEWREGHALLRCLAGPQHGNRGGIVHGGVLLSLLDQANAFSGLHDPARRRSAVTLDLDARFTAPGRIGATLFCTGTLVTAGRAVFFARGEVRDEAGTLVAFGASSHRCRCGSGPHAEAG